MGLLLGLGGMSTEQPPYSYILPIGSGNGVGVSGVWPDQNDPDPDP